jgi:hypothetical protein
VFAYTVSEKQALFNGSAEQPLVSLSADGWEMGFSDDAFSIALNFKKRETSGRIFYIFILATRYCFKYVKKKKKKKKKKMEHEGTFSITQL